MNIFRGHGEFAAFAESKREQRTLIVSDVNTRCFSLPVLSLLRGVGCRIAEYRFPEKHLVPEIENLTDLQERALDCAYILGVGSGVVNDICKYVSSVTEIPYGILATAPSMDGYVSSVSALYKHGKKVTLPSTVPQDVLIDTEILRNAPLDMIVAGAGDMIGKYTSLSDWKLAHALTGEFYDADIVARMERALALCIRSADRLSARDPSAVSALIEGLILSGAEMQNAGNSRPASGSEHHISHYLEMAGERRGIDFAPHGIKVALGCLVVTYLYHKAASLPELQPIRADIDKLESVERLEKLYKTVGLPGTFVEIGVDRALLKETVENAHTVRDRFTILTLLSDKGVLREWSDEICDRFGGYGKGEGL